MLKKVLTTLSVVAMLFAATVTAQAVGPRVENVKAGDFAVSCVCTDAPEFVIIKDGQFNGELAVWGDVVAAKAYLKTLNANWANDPIFTFEDSFKRGNHTYGVFEEDGVWYAWSTGGISNLMFTAFVCDCPDDEECDHQELDCYWDSYEQIIDDGLWLMVHLDAGSSIGGGSKTLTIAGENVGWAGNNWFTKLNLKGLSEENPLTVDIVSGNKLDKAGEAVISLVVEDGVAVGINIDFVDVTVNKGWFVIGDAAATVDNKTTTVNFGGGSSLFIPAEVVVTKGKTTEWSFNLADFVETFWFEVHDVLCGTTCDCGFEFECTLGDCPAPAKTVQAVAAFATFAADVVEAAPAPAVKGNNGNGNGNVGKGQLK